MVRHGREADQSQTTQKGHAGVVDAVEVGWGSRVVEIEDEIEVEIERERRQEERGREQQQQADGGQEREQRLMLCSKDIEDGRWNRRKGSPLVVGQQSR